MITNDKIDITFSDFVLSDDLGNKKLGTVNALVKIDNIEIKFSKISVYFYYPDKLEIYFPSFGKETPLIECDLLRHLIAKKLKEELSVFLKYKGSMFPSWKLYKVPLNLSHILESKRFKNEITDEELNELLEEKDFSATCFVNGEEILITYEHEEEKFEIVRALFEYFDKILIEKESPEQKLLTHEEKRYQELIEEGKLTEKDSKDPKTWKESIERNEIERINRCRKKLEDTGYFDRGQRE